MGVSALEQQMDVNDVLKRLYDAKKSNIDWREIGQMLDEVRTHGRWRQHYESPSSWMNSVSEKSGYSVGMLQRMLASRRFLSDMAKENPKKYTEFLSVSDGPKLPLAAVEIVKRIFDIDPHKGQDLLNKVAKDEASFTTVKKEYNAIIQNSGTLYRGRGPLFVSAGKMGLRQARQFSQDAFEVLMHHLPEIVGREDVSVYFRKYRFKYVTLDAVAVGGKRTRPEFVDGFDFRFLGPIMIRARRKQVLAELVFASSFFRSYWLFVPEVSEFVQTIAEDLQKLEVTSIGIGVVDTNGVGTIEIILQPQRTEFSGRQELLLEEILQQGLAKTSYMVR